MITHVFYVSDVFKICIRSPLLVLYQFRLHASNFRQVRLRRVEPPVLARHRRWHLSLVAQIRSAAARLPRHSSLPRLMRSFLHDNRLARSCQHGGHL